MEIDQVISFGGKDYVIRRVFYRTIGSYDQQLTPYVTERTDHRRTFSIVSRKGRLFWVKEYTQPDYGHSILYEFEETSKFFYPTLIDGNEARAVRMIGIRKNRLLMEYCDGYVKLRDAKFNTDQRTMVVRLISKWIDEHDVHDYDMCENNILVTTQSNLSLKLIDFEYSVGVNQKRWCDFLTRWWTHNA